MNRIDAKFRELKRLKRKAFIAYITAGDPGLSMTAKLVLALERAGVDIIELGVPFSDPLADGPTIQAASQRALKKKASLKKTFELVQDLRRTTDVPLVFMTYYNPVLAYGIANFFRRCETGGVDGVIVPDLPCEEADEVVKLGRAHGIATIFLAAPTSTAGRLKNIARMSTGFIYYVSLTGVTGARKTLPSDIIANVKLIKALTGKPVVVGFGVSSPQQARALAKVADGVIVGSAIVDIIGKKKEKKVISLVSNFAKSLAKAIHNA